MIKVRKFKYKRFLLAFLPWLIFRARRKGFDYTKNILIIAVGRGGSTWIAQMLSDEASIILFEPFSDLLMSKEFDKPLFAKNSSQRNFLRTEFYNRFTGKNLPVSAFVGVSIKQSLSATKLIFKTINLQFELESLVSMHYQISNRTPLAINRHPMPVIMSELNMKNDYSLYNDNSYYKERLCISESHPYYNIYNKVKDMDSAFYYRFAELLYRYKLVLDYRMKEIIVFDYETIRINPEDFVRFAYLKYELRVERSKVIKLSKSTLLKRKQNWRDKFANNELEKFGRLFEITGTNDYYNLDSELALAHKDSSPDAVL